MTQAEPLNPLGLNGIEFIEYLSDTPSRFGALLEQFGFQLVARHRSREVSLYRAGSMNIVVNAENAAADKPAGTQLAAIAFRVRDAAHSYRRSIELGAWPIATRASAMELNIPGIHGVGDATFYFVDRWQDFTIYDVDFVWLDAEKKTVNSPLDLSIFGVVHSIDAGRGDEWLDYYHTLFGFTDLPAGATDGLLPDGRVLASPCGQFFLQLIEPPSAMPDLNWREELLRLALGTKDVLNTVQQLSQRGVVFQDRGRLHSNEKGAVTQFYLGGVAFELVATKAVNAIDANSKASA